jgi:rRNA-processing protein FCF1
MRPIVSKGIINELSIISTKRSRKGRCASAALKEIEQKGIRIINASTYPDRWIKGQAVSKGTAVVTNDTALARELPKDTTVLKFSLNGRLRNFR